MDKSYRDIITINPNIRSGKPIIRGLRYTVYDILSYLAAGMTVAEILDDFLAGVSERVLEIILFTT